jgi:hypothetical protein
VSGPHLPTVARWHLPGSSRREALCGVTLLPSASVLMPELVAHIHHPDFDLPLCPLCQEAQAPTPPGT